ncbi:MAG: hypothetical protein ACKO86_24575, partial [Dolichospermum sp.]
TTNVWLCLVCHGKLRPISNSVLSLLLLYVNFEKDPLVLSDTRIIELQYIRLDDICRKNPLVYMGNNSGHYPAVTSLFY